MERLFSRGPALRSPVIPRMLEVKNGFSAELTDPAIVKDAEALSISNNWPCLLNASKSFPMGKFLFLVEQLTLVARPKATRCALWGDRAHATSVCPF